MIEITKLLKILKFLASLNFLRFTLSKTRKAPRKHIANSTMVAKRVRY